MILLIAMTLSTPAVLAQARTTEASAPQGVGPAAVQDLDTVVVSGKAPGPGLWRVANPEGHVLWVLGTLSPVPAAVEWDSSRIKSLVAHADEVLWEPYYQVEVDTGFFGQLRLGYGMWRAQQNPGRRTLAEVLPRPLHARWTAARQRLLPREGRLERARPIVAAQALMDAALESRGMTDAETLLAPILGTIRCEEVPMRAPQVRVELTAKVAKQAIDALRNTALDDIACLEATLDAIDHDLPRMITNANAWSTGQLDRVHFEALARRRARCTDAMTNAEFARAHGLPDIRASIAARWMEEARSALARNRTTLAIVALEDLIGPDGYAARLASLGYEVKSP
ncbi:TraB/GumN family protein [Luteimonas pelagia]